MDKKIPLSALIRIGCKVSGQAFCYIQDPGGKTCALGAAYLGKFGELPRLLTTIDAEEALGVPRSLAKRITQLNDYDRWSREKIADWLEQRGL